MSWTDVVGVKGVRDAKESPARCRARCLVGVSCRVCSLNGDVPTRHVVGETSPCPVEYSCGTGCGS